VPAELRGERFPDVTRFLLRSPLFWIGAFGAVFVWWAWWSSMKTQENLQAGVGPWGVVCRSSSASFTLMVHQTPRGLSYLQTYRNSLEEPGVGTPLDLYFTRPSYEVGRHWVDPMTNAWVPLHIIAVPYWLILLGHLILWCGLLLWRVPWAERPLSHGDPAGSISRFKE